MSSRIDKKINELIEVLKKEQYKNIEVEAVGAVCIKFAMSEPKYKYKARKGTMEWSNTSAKLKLVIDIFSAREIKINRILKTYEIEFENDE